MYPEPRTAPEGGVLSSSEGVFYHVLSRSAERDWVYFYGRSDRIRANWCTFMGAQTELGNYGCTFMGAQTPHHHRCTLIWSAWGMWGGGNGPKQTA